MKRFEIGENRTAAIELLATATMLGFIGIATGTEVYKTVAVKLGSK